MDGVVVVPADHTEALMEKVKTTMEIESKMMQAIDEGTIDRSWVNEMLNKKGCVGI